MEIYKRIRDFDYEISNLGNLRSIDRIVVFSDGRIRKYNSMNIKYRKDKNGYFVYCFLKNNIRKYLRIHRLVAEIFIPNTNNYKQVNHIDGNKTNNSVENLEWCTNEYNLEHARILNLNKGPIKSIIQYDLQNKFIREFESSVEAEKITGINQNTIRSCFVKTRSNKTAGGFIWEQK